MIVGNEHVYKAAATEHELDLTRLCEARYLLIRSECKPVDNGSTTADVPAGGCCHSGDDRPAVDSR